MRSGLEELLRDYLLLSDDWKTAEQLKRLLSAIGSLEIPGFIKEYESKLCSFLNLAASRGHKNVISTMLSPLTQNEVADLLMHNTCLALHIAAHRGHTKCLDTLLIILSPEQRLELMARMLDGCTAYERAFRKGEEEAARLLHDYKQQSIVVVSGESHTQKCNPQLSVCGCLVHELEMA